MTDFNDTIQKAISGGSANLMLSALAGISQKLDRIVSLLELRTLQPQSSPPHMAFMPMPHEGHLRVLSSEEDQRQAPEPLTISPEEKNTMRDSAGNPEIIRFPLPFGHGTIIYRKWPGSAQEWGFTLSVQGPDGIPYKYEREVDKHG